MSDKKVVDDYYSNIKSKDSSNKVSGVLIKKKIKIKAKKIVIKKKETISDLNSNENTSINLKDKTNKEKISILEKPFKKSFEINKVKVVERKQKTFVIKKTENRVFKKPFSKNNTTKSFNNVRSSGNDSSKKEKPKKIFHNNKSKQTSFVSNKPQVSNSSVKKNKFTAGKTRGKFNFFKKPEDTNFVRSNKVHKKIEKKVEDIKQNLTNHSGETIIVGDVLTLKEFSEKIGIAMTSLIGEFMKNGLMVNINSKIDFDSASIISEGFNIKLERDSSSGINIKDILAGKLGDILASDDDSKLENRCPVVSIMGHVDHGKTSILDYIRNSKITSTEAGGITQSIGAYQVLKDGKKITFLDTPGHEAFSLMRARGAKSTDIAVLVVAADEGVKPQTIESINHAKEAGIPLIVAINKMDKESANPDHVKGQLSDHGLTPEDWGGDTPMIPVSAQTGFGIDDLLEMILLVSEMKELKANPNRYGVATVIESHLDLKLGPVATVLINTGNINSGDNIVCSSCFGKVKILKNFESKNILKAIPGDPVLIVGLNSVVEGGDIMQVVPSIELAKSKSIEYNEIININKASKLSGLDILMSKIKTGNLKQLKIVIKSHTNGSLEAIKVALEKLSTPETNVLIIHSGVGAVTEGDVIMCEGSLAILVGFGVNVLSTAKGHLENSQIEFISNKIIYHITERIEKIVSGMLDPREVEIILGTPKVLATFYTSKKFMVVGLKLLEDEKIQPNSLVRVIRNKKIVGKGKILSMKQGVEEVKLLEGPIECGVKFSGNIELSINDQLEIYKVEIHK